MICTMYILYNLRTQTLKKSKLRPDSILNLLISVAIPPVYLFSEVLPLSLVLLDFSLLLS